MAGGNGAAIQITSTGAITSGAISTAGGAGITPLANGGSAGNITVTNNSTTVGAIAIGALTTTAGNAFGTGTGGTTGAVQVTNKAAGLALGTGAINTSGATNANGGAVTLSSQGGVTVSGLINTSAAARGTGVVGSGMNAGNITITGTNNAVTGAITASGGAGLGTNQNGGNAGAVSITGAGTLNTSTITVAAGAATGTGTGGTAGSITASGSNAVLGALSTAGPAISNVNGGAVSITTTGTLSVGTIGTGGGTANAGNIGRNAGAVTISAGGAITALGAITASGSAGVLTGDEAGGNGAAVSVTAVGGISGAAITASGGAAAGTNAAGGNAGSITVSNSGSGNITTGNLAAQTGNALGTGAGGTAGFVTVNNTAAAGTVTTGTVTTTGGTKGDGGNVTLSALGALSTGAAGTIATSGGTTITGYAGRNAGTVTLTGDSVSTGTGTITAAGSAGIGANMAGGNGAAVTVTGTGGAVSVSAISTTGGNGVAGNAAGGNAGAITLDAGGVSPTITVAGNLTATGGSRFGAGAAGAGAKIWLKDAVFLGAASVTADARGGNAGVGTGGAIQFDGAIDSTGGARALVANTNGATILNGAIGAVSPLLSLTTDAGGTTQISGGAVNTSGAAGQSYGDALTLTLASTLNAVGGTAAFGSTVAAGTNALTIAATEINFSGNVSGTGALTLKPSDTLTSMTIASGADTGATVLDLTSAELALVQTGFSSVTYGRTDSAAGTTVTLNSTQLRAPTTSILTGNGTIAGAGNITGDIAGRAMTVSAGSSGTINLSGTLGTAGTRLGAVNATAGGATTIGAINSNAAVLATAGANLVLNGVISTTDTTSSAIVASAGANFINNAGASALSTGIGGRWLIYTNDPAAMTSGSLASGNLALWNKTYGGNPPAGITQSGNRYLFNQAPNLTVTSTSAVKNYGDDLSATLPTQYTITGANTNTYAGAIVADSSVAISSLLSGTPTVSSSGAVPTAGVAGSPYAVNVSSGTLAGLTGYGLSFASTGTISVNKASLTVTADAATKTYGNNDPALTFLVAGLKNGDSAASIFTGGLSRAAGETVAGGPYAITQSTLAANANYNITGYTGANLSITPRNISVTANAQTKIYGNNDPALSYTVGGAGLANSAGIGVVDSLATVFSGALGRASGETVAGGPYAISQSTLVANSNYNVSGYTGSNLAITPRSISIAADAQSKIYGNNDPVFTYTVGGAGLANNAGIGVVDSQASVFGGTLARAAGETVPGGPYAISQGTLAANSNYSVTGYTGAALAITPRAVTVTANAQTKLYGGSDPTLTYTVGNLANNPGIGVVDTATGALTGSQSRTAGENVLGGPYAINQGTLVATSNYSIGSYTAGQLTVNPAPLSVTADDTQRAAGVANPLFTASYSGFVFGQSPAVLGGVLQVNTPAVPSSPVGTYAITPSGLTSSNYNISYLSGVLTVGRPAPAVFTNSLADALRAVSFSVLDPLASAVGSSGSVVVQSGMAGFLNTLPPSAAGPDNELEPAATGDAANGFESIQVQPGRRKGISAGCFSRQPLAQMGCSGG
jgi:hypothetical protein